MLFPLAGGLVAFLKAPGNSWAAVAVVVQVWWTFVLVVGLHGEYALKAAASAWPRLNDYRPWRYRFETHPWRHWFFPLLEWLVVLLALGALLLWHEVSPHCSLLGWSGDDWAVVAGAAATLLAVAGVIVNDQFIRPLSVAWQHEAAAVNRWQFEGRPDFSAPDGVVEWVP